MILQQMSYPELCAFCHQSITLCVCDLETESGENSMSFELTSETSSLVLVMEHVCCLECFINSVFILQVIKRLQSFSLMKSKKNRRSRRIRVFLKCPAAGSWSSTAQRPNSSARCPEKSKDRVFHPEHQNPAVNNDASNTMAILHIKAVVLSGLFWSCPPLNL